MARLRLTFTAALTLLSLTLLLCLCTCASASASNASASHHKSAATHKSRAARAARCRRYKRTHPHAHAHCASNARRRVAIHPRAAHHNPRASNHSSRHSSHAAPRSAHARAGACAGADEMPSSQNLDLIRSATLCLINLERSSHGERALVFNEDLEQAAQEHASDMAFGDYFEHISPSGQTPLSRMRSSGYIPSSHAGYVIGENIAWGTLSLATPRAIVKAWLDSPPHLANILDARFRDSAIGVSPHAPPALARGQAGAIYSQDFGVIIGG